MGKLATSNKKSEKRGRDAKFSEKESSKPSKVSKKQSKVAKEITKDDDSISQAESEASAGDEFGSDHEEGDEDDEIMHRDGLANTIASLLKQTTQSKVRIFVLMNILNNFTVPNRILIYSSSFRFQFFQEEKRA